MTESRNVNIQRNEHKRSVAFQLRTSKDKKCQNENTIKSGMKITSQIISKIKQKNLLYEYPIAPFRFPSE